MALDFTQDGWFDATAAAAKFGKRPVDWLRLDETKEYIAALEERFNCEPGTQLKLIRTKAGRHGGGTWFHPKLAVAFARWVDVKFGIACDYIIESILTKRHPYFDTKAERTALAQEYPLVMAMLDHSRKLDGKEYNKWVFPNEAKLINWAVFGSFDGVDRDSLSKDDQALLRKAQAYDMVLISRYPDYQDRKVRLREFVTEERASTSPRLEATDAGA